MIEAQEALIGPNDTSSPQFGITNLQVRSMLRRNELNGEYMQACNALPAWRK